MLKFIQVAGQKAFQTADALFNRVFGERLNPLYYLGSISYWLFWLVVASGFYLYAFYETGVDTTYESVQALTNDQWYAGGILRSMHRYASDAMVLTMLLHMLRHFLFDRYRSFRAFSWISGVAVLWFAYASGINGFMLPWDRLAQYVTVATAEWFDALPVFRGALVRNFVLAENISDRFFSLLSFLHIGIPLAMLAALWIHTQRVPQARTMPPRALIVSTSVTLLVLSIVKPVISQGPAALDSVATTLAFDWFFLTVYPLLLSWSPAMVWVLVGSATILAILLPWLPPQRQLANATTRAVFYPMNRPVMVRSGESLLDAGLRAGLTLPFECRSGGCGVCKATLVNGQVQHGAIQPTALSEAERAMGKVLLCRASVSDEVAIELDRTDAVNEAAPQYLGNVAAIEPLAHDVIGLTLQLQGNEKVAYLGGQYVNVILDDGDRRSYSFTEASGETATIELHIRRVPGGRFTSYVFDEMKVGDVLRIEGPLGDFVLREPSTKPILFVAGATGFAPVKSLLEEAFNRGIERPLHFYWGVRARRDLYMADLPEQWAREHRNFKFVPVLSEPSEEDNWTGRVGLVHEVILEDFPDMSELLVYACGSLRMVEAARPAFLASGLQENACFSDAFTEIPSDVSKPVDSMD